MQIDLTNPTQRTPCILVLDASTSMTTVEVGGNGGQSRMQLLNEGIKTFAKELHGDPIALSRVQVAAVNVGGPLGAPRVFMDWTDAASFGPFEMSAAGNTPLGEAVSVALQAIEAQKAFLKEQGISYTRPWLMVFTDGEPTDSSATWEATCEAVRKAEATGKVEVFPIAVGQADLNKLSELAARPPIAMNAVRFHEFFVWLSASLGQIARSGPGARVDLPPIDPWASVRL
jgi:uncharacterized protein YegL